MKKKKLKDLTVRQKIFIRCILYLHKCQKGVYVCIYHLTLFDIFLAVCGYCLFFKTGLGAGGRGPGGRQGVNT